MAMTRSISEPSDGPDPQIVVGNARMPPSFVDGDAHPMKGVVSPEDPLVGDGSSNAPVLTTRKINGREFNFISW